MGVCISQQKKENNFPFNNQELILQQKANPRASLYLESQQTIEALNKKIKRLNLIVKSENPSVEKLRLDFQQRLQKDFTCPITYCIMEDPVVAADGHTYSRQGIKAWFIKHDTSPLTNQILPNKNLIDNFALKRALDQYRQNFMLLDDQIKVARAMIQNIRISMTGNQMQEEQIICLQKRIIDQQNDKIKQLQLKKKEEEANKIKQEQYMQQKLAQYQKQKEFLTKQIEKLNGQLSKQRKYVLDQKMIQTSLKNKLHKLSGIAKMHQIPQQIKQYQIAFDNGISYRGELKLGKKQGYGVQTWPDGSKYEGQWTNDKANGKGKFQRANKDTYQGQFKDDKAHGYGVYTNQSGSTYKGNWINDKQSGHGIQQWPNGDRYEGNYAEGNKQGFGVYLWPNGDYFQGNWKEGRRQGWGKQFNSATRIDMQGTWSNDRLIRIHRQNSL